MNNGYGNLLPAMTPSINLGYSPYPGNGYGHLSNLLDMGMPIHNTISGLPGTLSTSPTSSPLTNSLPPIIHQQQQHHHHHHQQQQHHHQQQQHHHHQQQQHHQYHHLQHSPFSPQQQPQPHHQPNQSQQQTPQPSPQHTSNSIPPISQSLPSSDSIQSPPIYSELGDSLLTSSTNGNSNNNSNSTHIQNISLATLAAANNTTTTTTSSSSSGGIGSPEEISSPKIKSKKLKSSSNGKGKPTKVLCSPLESSLNSLTKEQLVHLCSQFFQSNHPDLIQEFENLMPPPDLHEIMMDLDSLQKKYNKLFPNNEFSYDNASYNRVKSGLAAFKKALVEYGEDFKEKNGWATLLQYVILALPYALRMPQWDDEKNNASRISALNKMDVFGKAAVKGLLQNDLSLEKWERHKNSLSPHTLYLKSTIDELDKCIDKRKKKEEKYEKTKKRKKIEK